jgi:hypothetical protein
MNIIIKPEFRDLIPPLTHEEREQLTNSIVADGCISPLIVWEGKGILLDGHNRYEICMEYGVEFAVKELHFDTESEVEDWMILNQLGRRNVSPDSASALRGRLYNARKKSAGAPEGNQNAGNQCNQNDNVVENGRTAEIIAKETGVSTPTVVRDGKLVDALEKLGISIADYMAGKARDEKGKKRSKSSIIAEAFPPDPNKPAKTKKSHPATVTTPEPGPEPEDEHEDERPLSERIVINDEDDETPEPAKLEPEPETDLCLQVLQSLPKLTQAQRQEVFAALANRWGCVIAQS